mmetsp:Transcript_37692/g.56076  ORF Transcript_37692/g.56076 Transcript_37692/m.56076 type:complete len:80 (+) Transcript_37692:1-240(+)
MCIQSSSWKAPDLSDVVSLLSGHITMLEARVENLADSLGDGDEGDDPIGRTLMEVFGEVKGALRAVEDQLPANPNLSAP